MTLIFSGCIYSTNIYRGRTPTYTHPHDFLAHSLPLFGPKPAALSQKTQFRRQHGHGRIPVDLRDEAILF